MRPKPKYQVFISSTYTDLREERETLVWEMMKLGHIPAGMEAFTARPDRGWPTISQVIQSCDYYVLVLAGRYGSIEPGWNQSWTHHEYDYAVSQGLPVLAFIRDRRATPADQVDDDRTRIEGFIRSVKDKHLVKVWGDRKDLAREVSAALQAKIREDEYAPNQRSGWYRGYPDLQAALEQIDHLEAENARLRRKLTEIEKSPPRTDTIHIAIRNAIDGNLASFEVSIRSTVKQLIQHSIAHFSLGGPLREYRLFHNGRYLPNDRTISDAALPNRTELKLMPLTPPVAFDLSNFGLESSALTVASRM
jgi:hypothetical protein